MVSLGFVFVRAALCSLSVLFLVHTGTAEEARVPVCKDGSLAVLEHSAVYMGKDTSKWICNVTLVPGVGSAVMPKLHHLRDFDLCTADCTTYCDNPVLEGGPNMTDCNVLASYYQNAGRFTIDAQQYIIWQYDTCRVTQYNRLDHADQRISYCFDHEHWAGVVDRVSSQCGPKANAHGGNCYFYDSLHFSSIAVEKA